MLVKAVIFDLDGTILDSFRDGLRRIKRICAIEDIPFTRVHRKRLTKLWGKPGVELLMEGMDLGEELVRTTLYPAWERLDIIEPPPLILGAREVLSWLKRNKIVATLLTSRHKKHTEQLLDLIDLSREFVIVHTKEDSPFPKPDPRAFRFTIEGLAEKFGIQKDETIFVGDTPADIDAGQAIEIETLLVQTGPYLLRHAKQLPFGLDKLCNVLNSIDDVPEWIEEHHEGPELSFYW